MSESGEIGMYRGGPYIHRWWAGHPILMRKLCEAAWNSLYGLASERDMSSSTQAETPNDIMAVLYRLAQESDGGSATLHESGFFGHTRPYADGSTWGQCALQVEREHWRLYRIIFEEEPTLWSAIRNKIGRVTLDFVLIWEAMLGVDAVPQIRSIPAPDDDYFGDADPEAAVRGLRGLQRAIMEEVNFAPDGEPIETGIERAMKRAYPGEDVVVGRRPPGLWSRLRRLIGKSD